MTRPLDTPSSLSPSEAVRIAVGDMRHRIRVVDEGGNLLTGAYLSIALKWSAVSPGGMAKEALGNEAVDLPIPAGSDGLIRLGAEVLRAIQGDYAWVAAAAGHVSRSIDEFSGDETRVMLQSAGMVTLECLDEAGRGVPGVTVALTKNSDPCLARQAILACRGGNHGRLGPGAAEALAVRVATTSVDGVADFHDVAQGTHYVELWSSTHVVADASTRIRVDCPGSIKLRMTEVLGCVFRTDPPERMVAWMALRNGAEERSAAHVAFSGPAYWDLARRFPGCCVLTGLPKEPSTYTVRVAAIIDGHGRWDSQLPMQPIGRIESATVIDVAYRDGDAVARLTWETSPPLAVPQGFSPPRIMLKGSSQGVPWQVVAEYGRDTLVPLGKCEVHSETFALARACDLPKELDLRAGQQRMTWALRNSLVPCRITMTPKAGCWGALDVAVESERETHVWAPGYVKEEGDAWGNAIANAWLPVGPMKVRAMRGSEEVVYRVDVGPAGCAVDCDVSALARAVLSK